MTLPSLEDADLKDKQVFLRGDIDVPLVVRDNGKVQIADATRLEAIQPTIDYLLQQNCTIILAGHLGRPEGKVIPELSARPVAEWFADGVIAKPKLSTATLSNNLPGFLVNEKFIVLENLRFDPGEESNDEKFAKTLASVADVYINDAFADDERPHASIIGVPKILPHYAGFRLLKEVDVMNTIIEIPRRPLVVIIGGAKLETKLPLITKMAEWADRVVVGGELLREVKDRLPKALYLELAEGKRDTTLESVDQTQVIISYAATIVWNGPIGYIEDPTFQVGTRRLAELIAANQKAFKVVGGGDTVGFLSRLGLTDKFDWVSIGGGAMLKFLSGEELPAIKALQQ